MASEPTLLRLQAEFDNPPEFLEIVAALLDAGASPEFINHYRRDETGDLGEARILEIAERLHFLEDLETRKQAIRDQAAEKGELDDALQQTLTDCFDQDLLDDIYQTFRPSRRTAGVQAREKGLGALAEQVGANHLERPLPDAADAAISAENDLPTRESVLEGVLHILEEDLAADPVLRSRFRRELAGGILRSSMTANPGKGANRYKSYFEFSQPVRKIPANQLLDIWRGEREGVLAVSLALPPGKGAELVEKHAKFERGEDPVRQQFLDLVYQHAAEQLLLPSCEADVRHQIKERVDRTTALNLARNLRSQLMAPPLGNKRALGVRASRNTVWLAMLGEDASVEKYLTLSVDGDEKRAAALARIAELIETEKPDGIALPHGRHQDVTSELVQAACANVKTPLCVVPVDEAASAVHATSASARKEWPGLEVGVRTAVSLANRLQDSMHELLSLDPKALGLGQALDEVHQGLLSRILDQTVTSCVAKIGMDLNRAGVAHLARVPGMTREMAKRIFDRRKKLGGFKNLAQLREDDLLGEGEFQQVAGFLRIWGGDQPLDATGIHPDDYPLVDRIAAAEGGDVRSLLRRRANSNPMDFVDDVRGPLRVRDVFAELQHYGDDVRGRLVAVRNENVDTIADLRPDMQLRGRVTNLTEFGAFVDLGIHQDGLVHVSQIPGNRLREPKRMLAVGEVITVFVLRVDVGKKRISLSMHKPRHLAEGRQPTIGERMQAGGGGRPRRGRSASPRPEPMTRAARAPEGRRSGGRRGAPRPASGGDERRPGGFGGGGRDRGRTGRGTRAGAGGAPRVITVESGRPVEESRGHRGELTSLSSLANLLGGTRPPHAEQPANEPAGNQPPGQAAEPSPTAAHDTVGHDTAAHDTPASQAPAPGAGGPLPALSGPATPEATGADSAESEPARAGTPAPTDPAPPEATATEPTESEPTESEPTATEPASTEPASTEPAENRAADTEGQPTADPVEPSTGAVDPTDQADDKGS